MSQLDVQEKFHLFSEGKVQQDSVFEVLVTRAHSGLFLTVTVYILYSKNYTLSGASKYMYSNELYTRIPLLQHRQTLVSMYT